MPKLIYTVLSHFYESIPYDSTPWEENDMGVISHHLSLRAANRVIIDMKELEERELDLDRDLTGEHEEIENQGGEGYVRHSGGLLDVMESFDTNHGSRMWVVAHPLDEDVYGYGDKNDGELTNEEEKQGRMEDEAQNQTAAESSLKRSAPVDTDELRYMGTKKVKGS